MARQHIPYYAGILLLIVLVAFPFVYTGKDYPFIMHLLIVGFFYAILASSWSMLAGYAGQFSFGHMGFMAVGAYTAALFSHYIHITPEATNLCTEYAIGGGRYLVISNPIGITSSTLTQDCLSQAKSAWGDSVEVQNMPVWLGIFLGAIMGAVFGFLIGILVLPLRAAYLALFTLGFSEILRAAISAEISITRGQAGLELPLLFDKGITIFGTHFDRTHKLPPYFVMFFLLLACLAILTWLSRSKFGLFVRALREDQDAAAALGVNTTRYKVLVFVVTSTMAATAGGVFGHYVGIITPNNLVILQMSLVVAMAVIGGVENFVAAAVGAVIIEFTLELLRNNFNIAPLTSADFGMWGFIAVVALLIVVVRYLMNRRLTPLDIGLIAIVVVIEIVLHVSGNFELDMTLWRLVVFGVLLMITLRFSRNGLISPMIDYFARGHVGKETVAKRMAASDEEEETA